MWTSEQKFFWFVIRILLICCISSFHKNKILLCKLFINRAVYHQQIKVIKFVLLLKFYLMAFLSVSPVMCGWANETIFLSHLFLCLMYLVCQRFSLLFVLLCIKNKLLEIWQSITVHADFCGVSFKQNELWIGVENCEKILVLCIIFCRMLGRRC